MKIRDLMNIITESEKAAEPVNEMFDGIKDFFGFGPNYKQYPDSDVYIPHTKGKSTGHKNKRLSKIDDHYLYDELCSTISYIEDASLSDPNLKDVVKKMHELSLMIANKTGYKAFEIERYCASHRRSTRQYDAVGWDNIESIYDNNKAKWNRENPHDMVHEGEQLDELLGFRTGQAFGIRTGPKQSDLYANSADVLKNDFEDNENDWGARLNFERHMPDIEKHPDFVRVYNAIQSGRYDLRTEMDMCKGIARKLNHTTGQVHAYVARGPYYRRSGTRDTSKWSPTDGPNSPYYKPDDFKWDGDNPANDLPGVRRGPNGKISYIPDVDD